MVAKAGWSLAKESEREREGLEQIIFGKAFSYTTTGHYSDLKHQQTLILN